MVDIAKNIQSIAKQVYEASKPMKIVYGNVISVSPLKIKIDQKLELTQDFLILTRNVIDYEVEVTINNSTQRDIMKVYNGLIVGDDVIMSRDNGGQRYVIIDKVVK